MRSSIEIFRSGFQTKDLSSLSYGHPVRRAFQDVAVKCLARQEKAVPGLFSDGKRVRKEVSRTPVSACQKNRVGDPGSFHGGFNIMRTDNMRALQDERHLSRQRSVESMLDRSILAISGQRAPNK